MLLLLTNLFSSRDGEKKVIVTSDTRFPTRRCLRSIRRTYSRQFAKAVNLRRIQAVLFAITLSSSIGAQVQLRIQPIGIAHLRKR
uniref:Uncharacterized protein n=1 Tax=Ditylenchus dipsaci TaxID=166011 RepID=A0A915DP33_9BILA